MSLLSMSITLASEYHAPQTDKNGCPYILHPLRVMLALREKGYPELYQSCGVLHDILEDTACPEATLRAYLSDEITNVVLSLTRRFAPNPDGVRRDDCGAMLWGPAQETYQEYFLRCVENPIARIIKYYDILDNTRLERFHPSAPYGRWLKSMQWYKDNGVEP